MDLDDLLFEVQEDSDVGEKASRPRTQSKYEFPDYHLKMPLLEVDTSMSISPNNVPMMHDRKQMSSISKDMTRIKFSHMTGKIFTNSSAERSGTPVLPFDRAALFDAIGDSIGVISAESRLTKERIRTILEMMHDSDSQNMTGYAYSANKFNALVLARNILVAAHELSRSSSYTRLSPTRMTSNVCKLLKFYGIDQSEVWYKLENARIPFVLLRTSSGYHSNQIDITILHDHVVIVDKFQKAYSVGKHDHLLMIADTLTARHLTLQCLSLPWRTSTSMRFISRVKSLFRLGDQALSTHGDIGYDLIKSIEPLSLGAMKIKTEQHFPYEFRSSFTQNTMTALEKKLPRPMHPLLNNWLETISGFEPSELAEVFGLFRHWGHPEIDPRVGLTVMRSNSQAVTAVDSAVVNDLANDLAYLVLNRYYMQHGKYPPNASIPAILSPEFASLIINGKFPSQEERFKFKHLWRHVKYDRISEVPPDVPLYSLLGDKSHSVDKDEFLRILRSKGMFKSTTRRVLLTVLKTDSVNIKQFLDAVNTDGLPDNSLIIGLKPKERELKREGRFFSLMSFLLRLYFVATEWLIAKEILPLVPEVTMTAEHTELLKRMGNASQYSDPLTDDEIRFYIHIDFEKWNNFQRHESTSPVFNVMDRVFGWNNVISRTHKIFESLTIYYAHDVTKINTDPTCQYMWTDHKGGLEGLRQKGWSVIGALMLRRVNRIHRMNCSAFVSGDNQVVVMKFKTMTAPNSADRSDVEIPRLVQKAQSYLTTISQESELMGLVAKNEETLITSAVYVFGKNLYWRGVSQTSLVKRYSRFFSYSNDTFPSLVNSLSTISTVALTVLQFSSDFYVPIAACYYQMLKSIHAYFIFDPIMNDSLLVSSMPKQLKLTDSAMTRWILDVLFRDSILGGLGGTSPMRFLVRQFTDPLTESLAWIKKVCDTSDNPLLVEVASRMSSPPQSKARVYKDLLENPFCLPIELPSKPSNILKAMVSRSLTTTPIQNKEIRGLISRGDSASEGLVGYLMSVQPKFIRFLSAMYASSPFGQREQILNRFVSSRTIIMMVAQTSDESVQKRMALSEMRLIREHYSMVRTSPVSRFACSYQKAMAMRRDMWGFDMVGVSMPHPSELFRMERVIGGKQCNDCSRSEGWITFAQAPGINECSHINGPFMPYYGSSTSVTRTTIHETEFDTTSYILGSMKLLLSSVGWIVPFGSELSETIYSLMDHYLEGGQYPRSVGKEVHNDPEHRFLNDRISHGGFSPCNRNPLSYISFNSNTLRKGSKGEENYNFVFQSVFIYYCSHLIISCFSDHDMSFYHCHYNCPSCLTETQPIILSAPGVFNWSKSPIISKTKTSDIYVQEQLLSTPSDWGLTSLRFKQSLHGIYLALMVVEKTYTRSAFSFFKGAKFNLSVVSKVPIQDLYKGLVFASLFSWTWKNVASVENPRLTKLRNPLVSFINYTRDFVGNLKFCSDLYTVLLHPSVITYYYNPRNASASFPITPANVYNSFLEELADVFTCDFIHESLQQLDKEICGDGFWLFSDTHSFDFERSLYNTFLVIDMFMNRLPSNEVIQEIDRRAIKSRAYVRLSDYTQRLAEPGQMIRYTTQSLRSSVKVMPSIGARKIYDFPITFKSLSYATVLYESFSKDIKVRPVPKEQLVSPLNHFFRPEQVSTSAYVKALALIDKLGLNGNAYIVGDGSGGFSSAYLHTIPDTSIVFNSLLQTDCVSEGNLGGLGPPCLLAQTLSERVLNWEDSSSSSTDLTLDETISYLKSYQNRLDPVFVLCDAETYNFALLKKIFINLLKLKCKKTVIKAHLCQELTDFLNSLTRLSIRLIRCSLSNWGHHEVYVELTEEFDQRRSDVSYEDLKYDFKFLGTCELQLTEWRRLKAIINRSTYPSLRKVIHRWKHLFSIKARRSDIFEKYNPDNGRYETLTGTIIALNLVKYVILDYAQDRISQWKVVNLDESSCMRLPWTETIQVISFLMSVSIVLATRDEAVYRRSLKPYQGAIKFSMKSIEGRAVFVGGGRLSLPPEAYRPEVKRFLRLLSPLLYQSDITLLYASLRRCFPHVASMLCPRLYPGFFN
uniref:Replicase n=1 Tax=Wenling dimarhabdovirus 10 TaxID=2116360 RepID=A0A2P1GNJ7_9RHAB|nr:hypothetical protein [Wenling dimarhabdovirus 10]